MTGSKLSTRPPSLQQSVRQMAARWQGKTVGLYGGSFNPAHDGHYHIATQALKRLKLNAVWLMVSPGNPLKDSRGMASVNKRFESAQKLADQHPKLFATRIETELNTRRTFDTIKALKRAMPGTNFVWLMGADNMAQMHRWYKWNELAHSLPIAIFDRPGYSIGGNSGKFAQRFRHNRVSAAQLKYSHGPAWAFVRIPRHPASATSIRERLGGAWVGHDLGSANMTISG